MKNGFLLLLGLCLVSSAGFAIEPQETNSTLESNIGKIESPKPWFVKVDGTSILLRGFGLGLGYNISSKVNSEIHYSQYVLDGEKFNGSFMGQYEATHKPKVYGIRVNTLPLSDFDKGGWYLSAGLVQVDLTTEIDPVFSDEIQTLSTQKTGYNVFTGYMFRGGIFKSMSSAALAGLGYGTGHSYSNNLGGTKNEIREGMTFDLSLLFNF